MGPDPTPYTPHMPYTPYTPYTGNLEPETGYQAASVRGDHTHSHKHTHTNTHTHTHTLGGDQSVRGDGGYDDGLSGEAVPRLSVLDLQVYLYMHMCMYMYTDMCMYRGGSAPVRPRPPGL